MDRSVHTNLVSKSHFLAKLCKSIPFGSGTCNLYSLHCCNVTNHPSTHENGKFLCDISSQCCPTILHDSNQSVIPSFYLLQFPSLSHPKVSIYHFQSSHQQTFKTKTNQFKTNLHQSQVHPPYNFPQPSITYIFYRGVFLWGMQFSKKSPTGPTERTLKPENLIARTQLPSRGPLGFGPIQFLMEISIFPSKTHLLHQPSKYLPGFILTSLAPFGPLPLRRFTHQLKLRGAERIRTRAAVRMQGDQQRHVLTSNI